MATFFRPTRLSIDRYDIIYVTDHYEYNANFQLNYQHGIRRVSLVDLNVTTLLGRTGKLTNNDNLLYIVDRSC